MITASEVHHILGDSENTWKGCLRGKLRGYREFINAQNNPPENTPVTSSASSLDWGVCFEPVVTDIIYPKMRGDCTVGEFGCIEHPHIPGLGASPDGIIVEGPMKYVGRMVEIKCPTSREYDPYKIKYEYWVQMQIQMEVCDLEECDFIECWFKEVEKEAWETEPEDGRTKGIAYRVASPEGSSWFHKKDELPENALITEKR
jgi:hypothetical protein